MDDGVLYKQLMAYLKDVCAKYSHKINTDGKRSAAELVEAEKKMNLPFITDEAIKQRDMLAKKTRNLQDAATEKASLGQSDHNRMIRENSELIIEMNLLRKEKKQYERKVADLENSLYTMSMERSNPNASQRSMASAGNRSMNTDSLASNVQGGRAMEGAHNHPSTGSS
jgi:hypothetical protein